jgi:hypothetical protein
MILFRTVPPERQALYRAAPSSSAVDIGAGSGTTGAPFDTSKSASIYRVSNGASLGHTLTFTWSGNVRSHSCEAAVRLGLQNGSTSECDACGYAEARRATSEAGARPLTRPGPLLRHGDRRPPPRTDGAIRTRAAPAPK